MRNKITILFLFIFTFSKSIFSQIVSEDVYFNNYVNSLDNDLNNHFYGMQSLIQIPANGITGGCLQVADSNNWGNDNSRYCSRYLSLQDSIYTTSICFKYNSALVNNGFDRATSIWVQPHIDPNHYVIATVSHNRKLEMYSYSAFTASVLPINLQTGNWYKLKLTFSYASLPNPFTLTYSSKLEDLGPSGTGIPILLDSIGEAIQDSIFSVDDKIEVSLTGARFGGAEYLDDLHFEGIKSSDSCIFTGIHSTFDVDQIKYKYSENFLFITGKELVGKEITIMNLVGEVIMTKKFTSQETSLELSEINDGIYFAIINYPHLHSVFKFIHLKNN